MAQFSTEDFEYIIILVKDIIYIFDKYKALIISQDISSLINGNHYPINPYKNNNNNLIFFISYIEQYSNIITIANCSLDLSNDIKNILIEKKYITIYTLYNDQINIASKSIGVSCVLLSHPDTLNMNNDLLTCFCGVGWPSSIFSITLDPENNFTEIFKDFKAYENISEAIYVILAKTY